MFVGKYKTFGRKAASHMANNPGLVDSQQRQPAPLLKTIPRPIHTGSQ